MRLPWNYALVGRPATVHSVSGIFAPGPGGQLSAGSRGHFRTRTRPGKSRTLRGELLSEEALVNRWTNALRRSSSRAMARSIFSISALSSLLFKREVLSGYGAT